MTHTIEAFSAACRDFLKSDPGPAGREKVRALLQEVLVDQEFIARHLGPDNTASMTTLFQDPELGLCILAHVQPGAFTGGPHDHGATWAIYGQAEGVTDMTEWRPTGAVDGKGRSLVEPAETYRISVGMARLYNEGAIHSTARPGPSRLIRITGDDVSKLARGRYAAVKDTADA
jgi:hypothetical protein